MSKRIEIVSSFYDDIDEDSRLNSSRHGQLEYATTMEFIHHYTQPGTKVLKIMYRFMKSDSRMDRGLSLWIQTSDCQGRYEAPFVQ